MARSKHNAPTKKSDVGTKTIIDKPNPSAKDLKSADEGVKKKPHRYRSGTRAIMEIRKLQKESGLLIAKAPFKRIVCEVAKQKGPHIRFQRDAIEALQEAAEAFLVSMFQDTNLICIGDRHCTIKKKNMDIAREIGAQYRYSH